VEDRAAVPAVTAAYFAGLVDGEGYIGIRTSINQRNSVTYRRYAAQITVTNCCRDPLDLGQAIWGGSIHEYPGVNKPVWKWQLSTRLGVRFARDLLPYLLIKKAQAEIVCQLADAIAETRNRKLTPDELAFRQDLQRRCRELNQRSYVGEYV
jgi:hypothetical protein